MSITVPPAIQPIIHPSQMRATQSLLTRQRRWGLIFLTPWIIGFLAFTFFPIVASLILTFTNFNLSKPDQIEFVGLANYQKLLSDPQARDTLSVTVAFGAITIPISIILPIGLAALLNAKRLWGKRFFRTMFYLPYMVPAVSTIFIWQSFLNSESGWLNRALEIFGIKGPNWLQDISWVYPALALIGTWGVGNAMLTTLATMQGVPTELYDAAKVDGAGAWVSFRRITLPMISPVIFYNLILTVIGVLQYFIVPYIITQGTGRPADRLFFFNMYLYKTGFQYFDMGYASVMAWVIFVIALAITIILFATARRWVYYASGD
jgi:ABC-type sugar transport system permease subunit